MKLHAASVNFSQSVINGLENYAMRSTRPLANTKYFILLLGFSRFIVKEPNWRLLVPLLEGNRATSLAYVMNLIM
jgi:hypothetical protein